MNTNIKFDNSTSNSSWHENHEKSCQKLNWDFVQVALVHYAALYGASNITYLLM